MLRPLTSLGTQLVADFYDCDRAILDDVERIRAAMLEAARRCRATIITDTFHRFSPHGVSGVVVIAESHLAIHTWPEHGYAAVDLFTCGTSLDADTGLAWLAGALGSQRQEYRPVPRGLLLDGRLPQQELTSPADSAPPSDTSAKNMR